MYRFMAIGLLAATLAAGGCAPKEWSFADDGAYDPLEKVNRAVYGINQKADGVVFKPLAQGYGHLPKPVRASAGNFLDNLQEPRNIVNNALQLRAGAALQSAGRFVFNTIGGFGGIFDVAKPMGYAPDNKTDFGQTLRRYGLNNTPYIVLPLLGPSSVADTAGSIADTFLRPARYVKPAGRKPFIGLQAVHRRYELLTFGDIATDAALDEYTFVRDVYEEKRRAGFFDEDEFASAAGPDLAKRQK